MPPRNDVAVSVNLSYSTAMLITPRLRVSYAYASDPLPYFKDETARENIT
jgi:hypothetical protein